MAFFQFFIASQISVTQAKEYHYEKIYCGPYAQKRRKNNLVWLFALLGILVLFLGTILAFLIFSNLSSKPTETVQEVSAVNGTGIVLPSHFTERKITDPSTARDAINDVADTLGIVSVEDELGTADCSTVLGDTYYSFPQVYRGIPVYGRKLPYRLTQTVKLHF